MDEEEDGLLGKLGAARRPGADDPELLFSPLNYLCTPLKLKYFTDFIYCREHY